MNKVLETVKQSVNVDTADTSFDAELLLSINMTIFKLHQLGVDVDQSFEVTDDVTTWEDLFYNNKNELGAIKTYFKINARLEFDPPASSFAVSALQEQKREIEWRLNTNIEGGAI